MRGKNWVFTLNNPKEEEEPSKWFNENVKYLIYQREKGEEGTEHYQGYMMLQKTMRLSAMKKINDRAHWEVRKGSHQQAEDYCSKEETRIGETIRLGTPPCQGKRTDLQLVADQVLKGKRLREIAEEHPAAYIRYGRGIERLRCRVSKPRNFMTEAFVVWGDTGVGKSRWAKSYFPNSYVKPINNKWWDGYDEHEVVIMDEFYGWLKYTTILQLLNGLEAQVETKGGFINFRPKLIVFTSNKHWEDWYNLKKKPLEGAPFLRRITGSYCWKEARCGLFSAEECTSNYEATCTYRPISE